MLIDPFDRLQDRLEMRSRMLKQRLEGPQDRLAERLGDTSAKEPKNRPLTPEQEASLFGMLKRGAVSGFESVGNLLDTTGASSRAALVGKNPLTAAINPEERVSGRDVLEHYGILGKNKPGLDLGDVAGFLTEIATDPMTYATLGGAALSTAGKAAKAAGLLKGLSRTQRMQTTVGQLLKQAGPEAIEKFARATGNKALPVDFLKQPIGGLVRASVPNVPGLPFRGQGKALFTGPRSQKFAQKLDKLDDAVRFGNIPGTNFSPGRAAAALFSSPVLGATTRVGQQLAKQKSATTEATQFATREQTIRDAMRMFGHPNGYDPVQMRRWVENVDPLTDPNHPAYEIVRRMQNYLRNSAQDLNRVGAQNGIRKDYLARQLTTSTAPGPGSSGLTFSTGNASRIARHNALNDLAEGTSTIQAVAKDPLVQQAIANGVDDKGVAMIIQHRFGDPAKPHFIQPTYTATLKNGVTKDRDRYLAFAKILKKATPDQLKAGYFGNDPFYDYLTKQMRDIDTATSAHAALEALTHHAAPVVGNAQQAGTARVEDVLRKLKLRTGLEGVPKQHWHLFDPTDEYANGALFEIARRRGLKQVDPKMLDEVIPAKLAEDILKFHDKFTNPKALHPILKGIDSLGSLFKAGVLTHPARYTRDFMGGQVQNMMHDMFSIRSVKAAHTIIRGGIPKGISKNPKVAELLTARGMPVTDKAATDLIKQLSFAGNLTNPGSLTASQIGGAVAQGPSSAQGILSQIPGENPFRVGSIAKKAIGQRAAKLVDSALNATTGKSIGPLPDTDLNPFNIHGVMNRKGDVRDVTTFGPVAAGNDVSYLTDALGRLSPFIHLLEQGVDPMHAIQKIKAAQVDYGAKALTQTERAVLTRLFPFFRFSKGMLPATVRELIEHPGGRTAQMIRATNLAHDRGDAVPEQVSTGPAIRIAPGKTDADRYITSLGTVIEDPMGFSGGGLKGAGMEALSRLNPLLKGPLEYFTGHSFFQHGPHGGRPLEDMDPILGRTLANITGRGEPYRIPLGDIIEPALANSPVSRLLSSLRTASDTRKSTLAKLMNLTTGVKITDVPERVKLAILRDRAQAGIHGMPGAKEFTDTYITPEALARLTPEQQQEVLMYRAILSQIAKKNKAAKLAAQVA